MHSWIIVWVTGNKTIHAVRCNKWLHDLIVFSPSCSSVRCFKWRLRTSGNVQLNERGEVHTKNLTVSTCNSVTFRSPGFYNSNKKHYSNNMFCVYNISMQDCNHITVRSTSDEHSLFDDGRDYLYFDFGQVTTTVTGDSIGSFSESVPTSSFYAVLWSDAEKFTSAGKFEFEAMCNDPVADTENELSGSGYI